MSPSVKREAGAFDLRPSPGTMLSDRAPWKGGRFSERSYCVLADNPSPLTYTGTNTWVLSEPGLSGCVVVDPGPLLEEHLSAIQGVCADNNSVVAAIVLTHDHPDHAEGAAAFAERVGVNVLSRREGTLPDGRLALPFEGPCLEVISLPGHSSDSVGLVFGKDASVVTGDFMFRQSSTLICWPDGKLADYTKSLISLRHTVRNRQIRALLTAHGLPIDDPLAGIDRQIAHRHARLDRVREIVKSGAGFDIDLVLEAVYDDIDTRLSPAARINVQAQLAYLKEEC